MLGVDQIKKEQEAQDNRVPVVEGADEQTEALCSSPTASNRQSANFESRII